MYFRFGCINFAGHDANVRRNPNWFLSIYDIFFVVVYSLFLSLNENNINSGIDSHLMPNMRLANDSPSECAEKSVYRFMNEKAKRMYVFVCTFESLSTVNLKDAFGCDAF